MNVDINFPSPSSPIKKAEQTQTDEQGTLSPVKQKTTQVIKESLEDEESWETDLPDIVGKIKQICPKEIQPKPADLFYGTDLIVYKDDYRGPLALNGIKEKDYKAIEKFLVNLSKNSVDMFDIKLNEQDKEFLIQDIKDLLTRQTGRNLIFKLEEFYRNTGQKIKFMQSPAKGWYADKEVANFVVYVDYQKKPLYSHTIDPSSGDIQPVILPSFITLGHECVHILHYLEYTFQNADEPTIDLTHHSGKDKAFDNVEEQTTITGFSNQPEFVKVNSPLTLQEREEWLAEYQVLNYQELNENALRAQFRLKPRVDHHGPDLQKSKPKDLTHHASDEFIAYVALIFKDGSPKQLEELIRHGWDVNKPIQFDQRTLISPLELAVSYGKLEFVKFLVDRGANPKALNRKNETLGHMAVYEKQYKLLPWLVDRGIDPFIKNHQGKTLFDIALAKEFAGLDSAAIKSMPERLKVGFADQIFQTWLNASSSKLFKASFEDQLLTAFHHLLPFLPDKKLKSYVDQLGKVPLSQLDKKMAKFYTGILEDLEEQFNAKKREAIAKQGYYQDENGRMYFS